VWHITIGVTLGLEAFDGIYLMVVKAREYTESVDSNGHALVKHGPMSVLRSSYESLQNEDLLVSLIDHVQVKKQTRRCDFPRSKH